MNDFNCEEARKLITTARWRDLPFMCKDDLRRRSYDTASLQDAIIWFSSSGSTGEPVIYPWTSADEEVANRAASRIHQGEGGWKGETGMIIAPTGLISMSYHMARQVRALGLVAVLPGVESLDRILDLIRQLRPSVLMGLPLVLCRLGEAVCREGATSVSAPRLIISGGDALSVARQERLERVWGAPVNNCYGLSEVFGPLAAAKRSGGVLTWEAPEVHVEILDCSSYQPIQEGETGCAVLTTLWHRSAWLRRYWTGDIFHLVRWKAPGQPEFKMKGREQARVSGDFFAVDIDDVLLSSTRIGNEWCWTVDEDGALVIKVETQDMESSLGETRSRVEHLLRRNLRLQALAPGTIYRTHPKLHVQPDLLG